jgi:hypothetical protein
MVHGELDGQLDSIKDPSRDNLPRGSRHIAFPHLLVRGRFLEVLIILLI